MAYAIENRPGQWVARFRGFLKQGRGGKSQAVVPRERLRDGFAAEDAKAYATECEQACRLLEVSRSLANVQRARALKAITQDQADALLARQPSPLSGSAAAALAPLTIIEAARAHPSSHREAINDVSAAVRHERELGAFLAWGRVRLVADVTLDLVVRYVDHLTKAGMSWDGRRHCLLWLRRATRMGATRGLPDVLGKLKLDTRPPMLRGIALSYWSLPELASAAVTTDDLRLRVAIGLGGFVGLRPSEVFEVEIPHLSSDDLLLTGTKNRQSERLLPLPAVLAGWVRELAGQRTTGRLITTRSNRVGGRGDFNEHSFHRWFVPLMREASGKSLGPKFLRKSFSSWGFREREFPPQHVEAYMGHKTALASIVTGRHYLMDLIARELQPSRAVIERVVGAALAQARAAAAVRPGVATGGSTTQIAS